MAFPGSAGLWGTDQHMNTIDLDNELAPADTMLTMYKLYDVIVLKHLPRV